MRQNIRLITEKGLQIAATLLALLQLLQTYFDVTPYIPMWAFEFTPGHIQMLFFASATGSASHRENYFLFSLRHLVQQRSCFFIWPCRLSCKRHSACWALCVNKPFVWSSWWWIGVKRWSIGRQYGHCITCSLTAHCGSCSQSLRS